MKFADFASSKRYAYDINEEFRTDAEGVRELYKKHDELRPKFDTIEKKVDSLKNEMSLLMFKITDVTNELVVSQEKGEKNVGMEKTYEKLRKEYEKLSAELEKLLPKYFALDDEMHRMRKIAKKIIARNAKRLGLSAADYVDKNSLSRGLNLHFY